MNRVFAKLAQLPKSKVNKAFDSRRYYRLKEIAHELHMTLFGYGKDTFRLYHRHTLKSQEFKSLDKLEKYLNALLQTK